LAVLVTVDPEAVDRAREVTKGSPIATRERYGVSTYPWRRA